MKKQVLMFYDEYSNTIRILRPSGYVELLDLTGVKGTWRWSAFSEYHRYNYAKKQLLEYSGEPIVVDSE